MSGHGGHDHHDSGDSFGKYIGIATAVLGLCVMVTAIFSHQAHNATITAKADASNAWSHYQAKKIRSYESELSATTLETLGGDNPKAATAAAQIRAKGAKYEQELKQLKAEAEGFEHLTHVQHAKGARLDLAEGMLEFGVILCSLYFLSKKKFFPALGGLAALAGLVMAGYAFFGPTPHEAGHGEAHPPAAHGDAHAPPPAH